MINYAYEASTISTSRTAHINVLGQSITVNQVGRLVFSPLTLAEAKVGGSYNQTLTCTNGTPPFSFAVSTGTLPPGITLSSAGVLAGIPSAAGNYTFEIKASDASTPIGPFAGTQTYSINVAKGVGTITLGNLLQPYDGGIKPVSVTTVPAALKVDVTYNGSANVPTEAGAYAVVATLNDPNYAGSTSGTLIIDRTSIGSSPTATPNPVTVLQAVTLSVSANSNNDPLSYAWDFGDGTLGTGASVTHNYLMVGTFHAVATVNNGLAPVTGSVDVTVVPAVAVIGTGPDSDGDGYSDSFEILASTDPFNTASSPAGVISSPANLGTLTIKSAQIKLNFARLGSDRIFLSGSLSVPQGFSPAGSGVLIEVGGVSKRLILGETGSVQNGSDSFKLKIKKNGGVAVANPAATFTAAFNAGTFAETLAATSQLNNATLKKVARNVTISVVFNGSPLSKQQALNYTANLNKFGEAK